MQCIILIRFRIWKKGYNELTLLTEKYFARDDSRSKVFGNLYATNSLLHPENQKNCLCYNFYPQKKFPFFTHCVAGEGICSVYINSPHSNFEFHSNKYHQTIHISRKKNPIANKLYKIFLQKWRYKMIYKVSNLYLLQVVYYNLETL